MRASATSFRYRYKLTSLFAVVALTLGLTPALGAQPAAVAGEADGSMAAEGEPLAGLLSSEAEGAGRPHAGAPDDAGEGLAEGAAEEVPLVAASQLSREVALQPLSEGGDVPLLADALAGKPTRFVDQEVSLDGSASVLGSFTVDGMTYAVTGEGAVELVAVAPTFPAGSLAAAPDGGSPGVPSGEDSGSGAPTSPSPSPEGASCDGFGLTALEVLDSVEHDGATYSVTSIGPCALAGCDADVVRIPASVASVDEAAFRGSAVGGVEVAEGNQSLASYEGVLYGADCSDLLLIPEGKEGVVRIPSNTSAIPPDAFSHCASVTAVEVDAGSDAFRSEDGCLYDAEGAMVFGSALMGAEAMERAALPLNNLASAGSARASSTVIHASSQAQCYWFGAPDGVNSIPSNATSFNGPYVANRNESFPDYYTLLANGSWGGSRGSWTIFTQSGAKSTLWFSDSALTKAIPVGAKMSNYFNVYPAAIKSFTVTFKKNEGTGGATSVSVVGGSSIGTIAVPTLSGWTFRGYTDDLGTQSFLFVSASGRGTTRTITSDKTLKANWTKTVSLNANGGTAGSLASLTAGIGRPLGQKCVQVASSNVDYPIRSLFKAGITDKSDWAPTRTGYTFAGYYDTSASTGGTCWITEDGTGEEVTSAIPSTLYARWTPNTYTCTFDKKGGTGGSDAATATYKASLPTVAKPALSGWTFQGYTDDLGTSTYQFVKASGAPTTRTWNYSGDKTLLANWTKTVSLNANGGTAGSLASLTAGIGRPLGQKCTQVASNNSDYPIRSLFNVGITDKSDWAPTRTGYTFAGYWSTSASSGGTCWIDKDGVGEKATSAIPSTLYARWTPNTYTVSFDANGGSGGQSADVTVIYDSAMPTISTTKPTRAGYAFGGWYDTSAASGGTQYYTAAGASVRTWKKTADAKLYARWAPMPYGISYDAAEGELPGDARSSYTIEDAFDLPVPTRYGYQFDGWDVEGAQGSGVETVTGEDGSKVTRVKAGTYGDLSCTARWTLRYDLDVPVCDPGSVTFEADSLTGQVRVKPGTSAEGAILSYMAVPVALDSLSCEGLGATGQPDPAGGAPELEAIFGAGSAVKVRFAATLGEGGSSQTARLTAGGAASLAGLSIPAAASHDAPGRIPVSYGLELDPDLAIPPVRDAAPVARLTYTVSLLGAAGS